MPESASGASRQAAPPDPVKPAASALAAVWMPGVYAWGACVAWPVFGASQGSALPRSAALLSLCCLLFGPLGSSRWPKLARAVGVLGFMAFAAAAWGTLGTELGTSLDPVRGALGALAFALFALGWGSLPGLPQFSEDDARVSLGGLPPRVRLPRATLVGFTALLAMAVALLLLAWRVERPGVALLAHALAIAGSIALLGVGTRALLSPGSATARTRPPTMWVSILAAWLLLGGLAWLL